MKALVMPRNLDDQLMILFWSADELLPGFSIFIVGVLVDQKLICLVIAIFVTKLFRKMKEGNQDGFLLHLAYWSGIFSMNKSRTFPNSFIREYLP